MKESKTEKKLKNLMKSSKHKVSIGHFLDSVIHYSGFTYPELMMLHHNGTDKIPSRPVLEILFQNHYKILNHPKVKAQVELFTSSDMKINDLKRFLQNVGEIMAEEEVDIFGSNQLISNATYYAKLKGEDAPLVLTEDLVRETGYKDTISDKLHTVM